MHMGIAPDDGPRYARNTYRLTKYTKNKLCIKTVFLNTRRIMALFPAAVRNFSPFQKI